MAEFLGDIAFMLEVFALATGLLIYHFGIKGLLRNLDLS